MSFEYTRRQGGVVGDSRPHGVTTTEHSRPPYFLQTLVAFDMASPRSIPDEAVPHARSALLIASERQLLAPAMATLQSFWPLLAQLSMAERLADSWVVSCQEAPHAMAGRLRNGGVPCTGKCRWARAALLILAVVLGNHSSGLEGEDVTSLRPLGPEGISSRSGQKRDRDKNTPDHGPPVGLAVLLPRSFLT
jgi:hypothetical protein